MTAAFHPESWLFVVAWCGALAGRRIDRLGSRAVASLVLAHEQALHPLMRRTRGSERSAGGQHAADVVVQVHDAALAPDHIFAALDHDIVDQRRDAGLRVVDAEIAPTGIRSVGDDN